MQELRNIVSLAIVLLVSCGLTEAQMSFSPEAEKATDAILDGRTTGDKLDCHATEEKPYFDFSFRFEIQYLVECSYRQFNGEEDHLVAVARVQPAGGKRAILGDVYTVPALPDNIREKVNIPKFKGALEFSGAIAVGEGEYEVELLVADEHQRYFIKRWKTKVERHGPEKKVELALEANHVAPLLIANVNERPADKAAVRLTVLLNAAPIFPYSRKLRAWDRAFLIGSLTSLMRQVPSASVRLIAFNTDQQRELFRSDSLNRRELIHLGDALRRLELGTVSYQTLRRTVGWAELLNRIVAEESEPAKGADAVVFLGPKMREDARIQRQSLSCPSELGPKLFYLEYQAFSGSQLPDSIDHLTSDCKGRVLQFHSPGEFGAAIDKMHRLVGDR